jgi:hypothetical protein
MHVDGNLETTDAVVFDNPSRKHLRSFKLPGGEESLLNITAHGDCFSIIQHEECIVYSIRTEDVVYRHRNVAAATLTADYLCCYTPEETFEIINRADWTLAFVTPCEVDFLFDTLRPISNAHAVAEEISNHFVAVDHSERTDTALHVSADDRRVVEICLVTQLTTCADGHRMLGLKHFEKATDIINNDIVDIKSGSETASILTFEKVHLRLHQRASSLCNV